MNRLTGKIVYIESSSAMSIADIEVKGSIFSAIVLETPQSASYLKEGQTVELLFKETEVAVAKNLTGEISLRNRIKSRIRRILSNGILTEVIFDYEGIDIRSIISTRSAKRLQIQEGEEAEWLVKTSEISLLPKE